MVKTQSLRASIPDHLTQLLIDNALDAGRDIRPGRAQREDGWTPERVRTFLEALSRHGVVAEAAKAAGISPKSAYALRNSAKGGAFDRAWQAAQSFARRPAIVPRSTDSGIVPIIRNGKVWDERYRGEARLLAALKRLDRAGFMVW